MSFCAASCCTRCPKASSASATLASLPTAAAPLSCRFAFDYSTQNNRRDPNQKPRQPSSRIHFGAVPNVAAPWGSSRDLPLPNSNSVLHRFSSEPLHETPITISLPRRFPSPAAVVRLVAPYQAPGFELPLANYNRTSPVRAPIRSITHSPSLSHHRNPIQFA